MTTRGAPAALNGFLATCVGLFAAVGWVGAGSAPRSGAVVHATLWPLIALQLLDAIAFGVASLAHARAWRARWLLQSVPLVLLAAAPVLAHILTT